MRYQTLLVPLVLIGVVAVDAVPQQPSQPPRSQMPDLGRPTRPDDPLPTLDFAQYFAGKWAFEWDMPDSPLGPAGHFTGVETYSRGVEGRFFETDYSGDGPQGRFTGKSVIIYNREAKTIARHETDSRGYAMLMTGTVGADLGGAFTIYYESAPFTYAGKLLRMKLTTSMTSPAAFRVRAQLSVDGGPFTNLGNPWWRKNLQ
jgi:Protein of unknown function (DUF1579)